MRASLRAGAAATAVLFTSACVDRYVIPPIQLQYLNGYDIHSEQTVNGATFTDTPHRLLTTQGQPIDYNSTKQLRLLGDGGTPLAPPGPFETIFISDDTFDAVPLGGPPVGVPLGNISSVEIVQPNPGETTALISLVLTVATLIPLFIYYGTNHSGPPPSGAVAPKNPALK